MIAYAAGTCLFAIRCFCGPAEGLWWDGASWVRRADRAIYSAADAAGEVEDADLYTVADVIRVGKSQG